MVRMTEAGERLEAVRFVSDPVVLAEQIAKAGPAPRVVVEATYAWYWVADVLDAAGAQLHLAHPLGVIPEAAELVKAGFVVCCDRFSGRFRRVWGVRHPQPGSRRSARSAARTNGLEAGEDGAILTLAGAGRGQ